MVIKMGPLIAYRIIKSEAIYGIFCVPSFIKSEPKMAPLGTQFLYKS